MEKAAAASVMKHDMTSEPLVLSLPQTQMEGVVQSEAALISTDVTSGYVSD